jgi:hypothetical protein
MQVISGPLGREKAHYQAPGASRLDREMSTFLDFFNRKDSMDPCSKRLARICGLLPSIHLTMAMGAWRALSPIIADMQLARSEGSSQRFYSMSSQIRDERKALP